MTRMRRTRPASPKPTSAMIGRDFSSVVEEASSRRRSWTFVFVCGAMSLIWGVKRDRWIVFWK